MKNIVRKLSMTVLIISSLMLSGCGSSNTEKPTEEPTVDVEKEEEIPFEKMTEEEMNVLVDGDVVTKLPNSEYLNEFGLDFVYVYNLTTKAKDGEYPSESEVYFTDKYSKDFEVVAAEYTEKHEFKEILIGEMVYSRSEITGKWFKLIKTLDDVWFTVSDIPQEKNDELEKEYTEFNK